MTQREHQMLMDIHAHIYKLPTKANLDRTTKRIIRKVASTMQVEEIESAPNNQVRARQVAAVRKILLKAYNEGRTMTLHAACLLAWEPLTGGYPTPKALYEYCHAHENEF